MFQTFWPGPLMATVTIVLSIIISPLVWWSVVPLAIWAAWRLRSIQDKSIEMFDQMPARLKDRVNRLGHLRDLRAELLRANIVITPGIERYLAESWEYKDLAPSDRRAIDAASATLTERAAVALDRQAHEMFSKSPAGDTSTCG